MTEYETLVLARQLVDLLGAAAAVMRDPDAAAKAVEDMMAARSAKAAAE